MSHFSRLIAVAAISLFSLAANASLFEIQCRVDENDRVPEFILLTEDHVNYTFAAFTIATRDKELEPRTLVTVLGEEAGSKILAAKKEDGVLQTIRFQAKRLAMKTDLFADLAAGIDRSSDLVSSAQLLAADGRILGEFVCRRLN